VEPQTSAAKIEVMTAIWERVLSRAPIRVDEDFFELGGDDASAEQLFREIGQEFGRALPPPVIYLTPTIASLVALLEKQDLPTLPPLVILKSGTGWPPIFLAHGIGGSVFDFFQLLKNVRAAQPIYGLQARGVTGADRPLDRIEDMAQYHLEAIRGIQPHGPYFLVGYSLGGLVMLEIAQRLKKAGEEIALLALLETYPHRRQLSVYERLRLKMRQAKYHAANLRGMPLRKVFSYLRDSSTRRAHNAEEHYANAHPQSPNVPSLTHAMEKVRDGADQAWPEYAPRFYRGKISFVKAQISSYFPDDPSAVWGKLADDFECMTVPGDHLEILTTYYEALAAALSRYLQEAAAAKSPRP
jgi:acetoacetyl-CoA synthetase